MKVPALRLQGVTHHFLSVAFFNENNAWYFAFHFSKDYIVSESKKTKAVKCCSLEKKALF